MQVLQQRGCSFGENVTRWSGVGSCSDAVSILWRPCTLPGSLQQVSRHWDSSCVYVVGMKGVSQVKVGGEKSVCMS